MMNVYESVDANKRKSWLVVIGFVLFVLISVILITRGLGLYLGYETGGVGMVGLALIISGFTSFISYYYSDRIILTISSARPADKKRDYHFFTVAENLSIAAGLPIPKLYVIDDTAMNAFATGRDPNHAVVCATTGLLERLDRTELEGVVGHELSHIANYDTRLMSIVTVMVGLITLLGDWLIRSSWYSGRGRSSRDGGNSGGVIILLGFVFALLSPIIARLIHLAISRRREYLADAQSVKITRQPSGLISALKKMGIDKEPLEAANKATAHLYIVNPLRNQSNAISLLSNLFNTHPPLESRIAALEQMS